jgi:hypothetical protein
VASQLFFERLLVAFIGYHWLKYLHNFQSHHVFVSRRKIREAGIISILTGIYRVSPKWRTNGALRYRRDYHKRQKNVKKIILDVFADLAVFESGTQQVNYFEIYV